MSLPGPKSQTSQLPTHPCFFPVTGKLKEQAQVLNPSIPWDSLSRIWLREETLEISALPGQLWLSTPFAWHLKEHNPKATILNG